jgi:cytochrome c biogenesis protein CcmG, thiol:disulfide interchange protein DsbE
VKRFRLFIPLFIFVALSGLLYWGLSRNPDELPSVLIGRALPEFSLPNLEDPSRSITRADVVGKPFLLNVWASWCPTCKDEHPFLNQLRDSGVKIVGVNYRDEDDAAKEILRLYNNPYALNMIDREGKFGIDLGVYGAPETFVVAASGVIVHKVVGAIDEAIWQKELAHYFFER